VNEEVLIEVGFMTLLNVAVIKDATGTAVAPFAGVTLTTTGNVAGACSRPQPAKTRIKRKARTDVILTAGNLEIITLCMRLLFELQSVKCHLDVLLSHRWGRIRAPNNSGSDWVPYRNALAGRFAKKILGLT
jgi:hypothetical protein